MQAMLGEGHSMALQAPSVAGARKMARKGAGIETLPFASTRFACVPLNPTMMSAAYSLLSARAVGCGADRQTALLDPEKPL
jgi:hypothetical protein